MSKRNVRCPHGGHQFLVEIKEGYQTARAIPREGKTEGAVGHEQLCPICNRPLFIKYNP
jgi:hypothetical protein